MATATATDLVQRVSALRRQKEDVSRELARTEGTIATLKTRLQEEFGCSTVAAGEKRLADLERETAELRKEVEEGLRGLAS